MAEPSKFRSPVTNARYTRGLFLEESYEDQSAVLYSLRDHDHARYPSLYRKYLEMGDLTEINFAREYFEGWEHWQNVCQCNWFKPYIARWRHELELQLKAQALVEIRKVAENPDHKSSYEANKFLLNGTWKDKKDKVGRPSKEEIKRQANELFEEKFDTTNDLARITN